MTQSAQHKYWSKRYSDQPDWKGGIHIGKFDGLSANPSLEDACDAADVWLTREISERCSLYKLVTGLKILEIGCGSGSLPASMAKMLPRFKYLGCDPAEQAIERAKEQFNDTKNSSGNSQNEIKFLPISCSRLLSNLENGLLGFDDGIDLIIIREVFYLMSKDDRACLKKIIETYTTPGASLFFSDLITGSKSAAELVKTHLYDRHLATAMPLRLDSPDEKSVEEWARELISPSLILIKNSLEIDNSRISNTYKTALTQAIKNEDNASSYQILADLSSTDEKFRPELFYLSAMFQIGAPKSQALTNNEIGFVANSDWENVFLKGQKYALPRGKWSLIVGRSGTGKTSLINAILADYPTPYDQADNILNPKDCYLFSQDIYLFENLSPIENVSIFNRDKSKATKLLQKLGIREDVIRRKRSSNISGGERQRIALAQCIAADSPVLILDEPFKGLDKSRRYVLFDIIEKEWGDRDQNRSLICIDHDFEFIVEKFDHVFEMMNGYLIEMARVS